MSDDDDDDSGSLFALVLTPTRELAFQIRDHLRSVAKDTGIKVLHFFGFHVIMFKCSVSTPLMYYLSVSFMIATAMMLFLSLFFFMN